MHVWIEWWTTGLLCAGIHSHCVLTPCQLEHQSSADRCSTHTRNSNCGNSNCGWHCTYMHTCAPCLLQMCTPQAASVLALQPLPCPTQSWPYSSRVGCEAAYDRCNCGIPLRRHAYACICARYSATMTFRALGDSRSSPAFGEMHMHIGEMHG